MKKQVLVKFNNTEHVTTHLDLTTGDTFIINYYNNLYSFYLSKVVHPHLPWLTPLGFFITDKDITVIMEK